MRIGHVVEIQQQLEVCLLDAGAVQLDAADLGGGPAEAVGNLVSCETGALAEPAQFGGEPTAADGRAAVSGHPSGSPRDKACS